MTRTTPPLAAPGHIRHDGGNRVAASCSMTADVHFERALSDFLAEESTVAAMVRASDSERPAVEAIGPDLLRRFGDRVRPNPVKQHIGRLVKPVMEAHGFRPYKKRRVARPSMFTEGTVYRCDPEPIATVLRRHGIKVPENLLLEVVRHAASDVVGNPPFAKGPGPIDWSCLCATSAPAHLRPRLHAFATALDDELAQQHRRRAAAGPFSPLTDRERARLGLDDLGNGVPEGAISARVATALAFGALCATAFTVAEAAELLRTDSRAVAGLVADRCLYGVPSRAAGGVRLPLFQFHADALLPKAQHVLPALDARIHPISVFNWFTAPDPDLALEETGYEPTSPRDWLLRGHRAEPVRRLAASLTDGAAA